MKLVFGLLLMGSVFLPGCAPCYRRAAMCPQPCGPCGSTSFIASQPCDVSGGQIMLAPESSETMIRSPGTSSPGIEGRVNSIENDLNSLKGDVGNVQRQNQQIERKLDKVIDHVVPLK